MKEEIINEVQRLMLTHLDNEQLFKLKEALGNILSTIDICKKQLTSTEDKTDNVNSFLAAKRLEGCSEKTMIYYRNTIEDMIESIGKVPQQITTDDLRKYLLNYQMSRKSSNVTIDNIRRILSSFFSWLEDKDLIVKSPVRRIHKVKS